MSIKSPRISGPLAILAAGIAGALARQEAKRVEVARREVEPRAGRDERLHVSEARGLDATRRLERPAGRVEPFGSKWVGGGGRRVHGRRRRRLPFPVHPKRILCYDRRLQGRC